MSFWRSPFPFPAKNLTQTRAHQEMDKKIQGTTERSFCQPKPLFFSRYRVAVGKISCKDCSQPHLPSECEWQNLSLLQVLQNPCPSFYKQDTQQERCLWGWGRHSMERGCYISAEKDATCSPGMSSSHSRPGEKSISAVSEPQSTWGPLLQQLRPTQAHKCVYHEEGRPNAWLLSLRPWW